MTHSSLLPVARAHAAGLWRLACMCAVLAVIAGCGDEKFTLTIQFDWRSTPGIVRAPGEFECRSTQAPCVIKIRESERILSVELVPDRPGHLVDVFSAGGTEAQVTPANPAAGTFATFSIQLKNNPNYVVSFRAPRAPTAAFTFDPVPRPVPVTVSLDASGSSDDRGIVRYEWDFENDGIVDTSGTTGFLGHQFTVAGTYPVRLRVVDGDGLSGQVIHDVTVVARPPPPPPPPPPGGGWQRMGDFLQSSPIRHDSVGMRSAVLDAQGRPVVAFREDSLIFVTRWDGTAWQIVGNGPVFTLAPGEIGSITAWPSIDIDANDRPVVAYSRGQLNTEDVFVARFENNAWTTLGGAAIDAVLTSNARSPSLKISPDGPAVAWNEGDRLVVKRFNGTAWVNFGSFDGPDSVGGAAPSLDIAPDGSVFVAWIQYEGFLPETLRAARGTAAGWTALGGAINPPAFGDFRAFPNMQLAVGADGAPVVAYGSFDPGTGVEVRRWDGASWALLGNSPHGTASVRVASLNLDIRGGSSQPLLIWFDNVGHFYHVQRLVGGTWTYIDNGPLLNAGGQGVHVTALDAPEPIVIENESTSFGYLIRAWRLTP